MSKKSKKPKPTFGDLRKMVAEGDRIARALGEDPWSIQVSEVPMAAGEWRFRMFVLGADSRGAEDTSIEACAADMAVHIRGVLKHLREKAERRRKRIAEALGVK